MQCRGGYHALAKGGRCFCAAKVGSRPGLLWVNRVASGRSRRSRHVRYTSNSDSSVRRNEASQCAITGREQLQQCEAKITRSTRRRAEEWSVEFPDRWLAPT